MNVVNPIAKFISSKRHTLPAVVSAVKKNAKIARDSFREGWEEGKKESKKS